MRISNSSSESVYRAKKSIKTTENHRKRSEKSGKIVKKMEFSREDS